MSNSDTDGLLGTGQQVTQAAADKASGLSQHATKQAHAVADTAMQQAGRVGSEAASQARDLASEARYQARTQAEIQIQELAGTLAQLGQQGRALVAGRYEEAGILPEVAEQLISKIEHLAEQTRSGGLDGVVTQVRELGRRRPVAFLGGAVGLGLVVGRMLRAGALQGAQGQPQGTDNEASFDLYAAPAPVPAPPAPVQVTSLADQGAYRP